MMTRNTRKTVLRLETLERRELLTSFWDRGNPVAVSGAQPLANLQVDKQSLLEAPRAPDSIAAVPAVQKVREA